MSTTAAHGCAFRKPTRGCSAQIDGPRGWGGRADRDRPRGREQSSARNATREGLRTRCGGGLCQR